jgi:hypothetical protein
VFKVVAGYGWTARLGPPFHPTGWWRLVTSQCRRAGRTSAGGPGLPANACPVTPQVRCASTGRGVRGRAARLRRRSGRGDRAGALAVSTFTGARRIGQVVGLLSAGVRRRRSRPAIASLVSGVGEPAGRASPDRPGMLQPQPSREEMLRDVLAEHLKRPLHAGRHQSGTKSLSETAPHPPSDTDRGFTARPSGRRRADPPGRIVVQTVTMGSRCPQRATLTPWGWWASSSTPWAWAPPGAQAERGTPVAGGAHPVGVQCASSGLLVSPNRLGLWETLQGVQPAMMRTPTDVTYRYKNRCNRICCCRGAGCFGVSRRCSRTRRHDSNAMGPAAVRLLPLAAPPRRRFSRTLARALTPAEATATFSYARPAHPINMKGGPKSKHSGQLGNCVGGRSTRFRIFTIRVVHR